MGINIYFERDPKNTPDKTACPNPASLTQIRCVYWGGPVTAGNTNNYGRKWERFSVVFAGSNGYVNQNIAAPSGYSDATYLNNAAINAPYDALGYNTYMGAKVFATGPFNATLCAEACNAQNVYNIANPPADGAPVQTCQLCCCSRNVSISTEMAPPHLLLREEKLEVCYGFVVSSCFVQSS